MLACAPAHGETVFKYRMPDGRVIYSDKPVPGGHLEAELQPPPEPGVASPPSPQPSDVDERIAARRDALERARRELDGANADLARAQSRLEAGRQPLPEEYKGIAGGGSRLGEEYEQRQAANERAVTQAKARVKRAEEELNRVRY
jgi:hypothetical protein